MLNRMKRKMGNKKGFTLIELIVVIAILGILAMIAIPRITGIQEDARKKADIANARTMASIISAEIANGHLTTDHADMEIVSTLADSGTDKLKNIVDAFPAGVPTVQTSNSGTNTIHGVNFKVTYTISTGAVKIFAVSDTAANQLYPTPGSLFK